MNNVRVVEAENGYSAVYCDGEVVAGVRCAQTLGSVKKVGRAYKAYAEGTFQAYATGGKFIGAYPTMEDAVAAVVKNAS